MSDLDDRMDELDNQEYLRQCNQIPKDKELALRRLTAELTLANYDEPNHDEDEAAFNFDFSYLARIDQALGEQIL